MPRLGSSPFAPTLLGVMLAVGCGDDGSTGTTDDSSGTGDTDTPTSGASEPGENDPAINLISPTTVYLDRVVEVSISGNATHWDESTTVDFGAGITTEILAASPGLLLVRLTIAEGAELGPRAVTVDGGGDTLILSDVFQVQPPLLFSGQKGLAAQGSIFVGRGILQDKSLPFDTADDGANLVVGGGAGVGANVDEAQPTIVDFTMFIDVGAAPADKDLRVTSGQPGQEVSSLAPQAFTVAARDPVPLLDDINVGDVPGPYESQLWSFQPGAHKLVNIAATAQDPEANPRFALLPPSGSFADLVSFAATGRIQIDADEPVYVIYWDSSGAANYSYDLTVETLDSDDLEPNSDCASAQPISAPATLANLSLRDEADEDWFVVDAAMADVDKLVHVLTAPGDDATDTFVEVFTGTCGNLVPLGDPSVDAAYHEDLFTTAITAAGSVYVRVSNSPSSVFGGQLYDLSVEFLPTEAEPNDTCAAGNAVGEMPVTLANVTLADEADVDWFDVTVAPADAGNLLRVTTSPGDENTDTYIEVYGGPCNAPALLAKSEDLDYLDSLLVGPLAAGTYRVKIANSPNFPYFGAAYNLELALEAPIDVEPNNTCATAQDGVLDATVGPLALSSITDVDWFVFPAGANDVGKVVHVVTAPGDSDTDTLVEVFGGACPNPTSLGGPSFDILYHEDWKSAPIEAEGPVFVKVSYSTNGYAEADYQLTVTFE